MKTINQGEEVNGFVNFVHFDEGGGAHLIFDDDNQRTIPIEAALALGIALGGTYFRCKRYENRIDVFKVISPFEVQALHEQALRNGLSGRSLLV